MQRPASTRSPRDAAFIVADMMSDRAARIVTFGLDNYLNTPFWSAVKTGTSKDMRDNWCIGFSRRYTVGVWVGNFEGDSMHDVSGVTGAAPVWHQIMLALHADDAVCSAVGPGRCQRCASAVYAGCGGASDASSYLRESAPTSVTAHVTAVVAALARSPTSRAPRTAWSSRSIRISRPPFQRVPLTANGVAAGMVFKLNGAVVGQANGRVLWSPKAGSHLLALEDSAGSHPGSRTLHRAIVAHRVSDRSAIRAQLRCASGLRTRRGHSPYRVAHIIRNEQRAGAIQRHAYRPTVRLTVTRSRSR